MKSFILILFSLLLSTCPDKNNSNDQETTIIENLFEASLFGDGEQGLEKGNLIIESDSAWKELLKSIDNPNNVSSKFNTDIDFSKSMILVAIDDVKTTGGFKIKITELKERKGKLEVVIKKFGPKANAMAVMIITQPIHIVKINKTNKEITFVEQE